MDLFTQPVLLSALLRLGGFHDSVSKLLRRGELSLYLRDTAPNLAQIPDDRFGNPTDEASTQGSILERTHESSTANRVLNLARPL